jgi:hypothetical protein
MNLSKEQPRLEDRLTARERPAGRSPVMFQRWRVLLFLHWEFDSHEIQKTLPGGLYTDTFNGSAYVGVVPFFMRDVHPVLLPAVPGISNFLELNLRTYVYDERGTPGIWFYSLDANQWLAVELAKRFFGLPYYRAEMSAKKNEGGEVIFSSRRLSADSRLRSTFRYRGMGPVRNADAGSLEFFLIERYILFSYFPKQEKLMMGRVHHQPYPLLDAEVSEWDDKLFELDGLKPPGRQPHPIVLSPGVDVDVFAVYTSSSS